MIVQISSRKSDILKMILGVYVFLIFIAFGWKKVELMEDYYVYGMVAGLTFLIASNMRTMLRNRKTVRPYLAWQTNKWKTLKSNPIIFIIGSFILSGLTVYHFYLYRSNNLDIMPLVYDYGIGGFAAIILQFFMQRRWNIGLSDLGIIYGSRMESKVVEWKNISSFEADKNAEQIILICKKESGLKKIFIKPPKNFYQILSLIEQSVPKT